MSDISPNGRPVRKARGGRGVNTNPSFFLRSSWLVSRLESTSIPPCRRNHPRDNENTVFSKITRGDVVRLSGNRIRVATFPRRRVPRKSRSFSRRAPTEICPFCLRGVSSTNIQKRSLLPTRQVAHSQLSLCGEAIFLTV